MSDDRPRPLRDHFDDADGRRERWRRTQRDEDGGEPTSDEASDGPAPLGTDGSDSIDNGPDLTDDITGDTHAGSGDVMDGVAGVVGSVGELGAILEREALELAKDTMEGLHNAVDRAGDLASDAIQTAQVLAGGDNPWAGGGSSDDGGNDGDDDDGDDGGEASGGDIISELGGELQQSTAAGGPLIDPIVLEDDAGLHVVDEVTMADDLPGIDDGLIEG